MFFKFLFRFMGSSPLPINFGVEPQLPSDLPPTTTQPPVSSSPSSSSFTHDSSWTYDVFLSFRGEDTRTNFTDHLHEALVRKGIRTFIDRELVRGEEISPALVRAIEESRISLIVFSENYPSSRWCLDELVKILQCKESKQQIVLPIFYKVDPSDVRKQTNSFGDAFKGLIQSKFKDDKKKVLIWKEALRQAANLSGHTFKDGEYEATFINNIVDGILIQVLSSTYWNVAKYPVEIQSHVQDVKKLLDVGGNGRRMVGIWGTSGIGKTTIAKAIWNAIAHEFEGSCFLPNVRENSMPHGGLIKLQKTLLHKYLGNKLKIQSVDEGIGVIKERLRHKKILLILDDVDHLEQLENLAGDDWFGEGSRVIITTKNRGLLENHGIELIYKVKKLDYNQALELFSWHAFGRSEPPKDYLELAQRVIAFADGLPLALTILGSHLRNRSIGSWQVILDGYKGEPYTHIERILQKSYDALDDDAKEVFLDIACFFKDASKDVVLQIVPKNCIEVLVDKAMITVEWDNRILMHDLLEKLGKDIVHKESPNDPGERSRLWFYEDVIQVLMESTGTRKIKGIMVKLPKPAEITLNPECFRNMVNLQIFINHNASLCGDINYLPNALRFIDWPSCQLQSLPPKFQGYCLVEFRMPRSHIRQLEGFKYSPNLTCMNLGGCQFLEKIPDLSGIPNMKYLFLSDCTSLVELDDSVGFLDKLVGLDLEGCVKLMRFATTLILPNLTYMNLRSCQFLEKIPDLSGIRNIKYLFLTDCTSLVSLDDSVGFLDKLVSLDLSGCVNLTKFGRRLRLKSLETLDLEGCASLESFPEIEVKMESLRRLDMEGSGIRELPPSIKHLTGLENLNIERCFNLTRLELRLLHCWSTLRFLDLSGANFVTLPECISKFVSLEYLTLRDCKSVREIPQELLPPRVCWVSLDNCTSLEKFPKLPLSSEVEYLGLMNCVSLRGYDITENSILDQVSSLPHSEFDIDLPGDEVPKWFSCCKDATLVKDDYSSDEEEEDEYSSDEEEEDAYSYARCEVCFEIPPNLDWETLRLAICVVNKGNACGNECFAVTSVHINGKWVGGISMGIEDSNVGLSCIPLLNLRNSAVRWEKQTQLQSVGGN
ncbi:PREDICTED: TMV resistance [Prunus dulcis]|uniref:PREDICTED: TMV resistance n=2 Tax=Prunus dulcis TaxID=3755 RepID=A0A5E4GLM6_PRUDU|nr:TMV resistance protein N-like isoform X1 [Prunus dulcis]VVA40777.1 PREDICTED: TMV resistance [Prunus dulcis]